MAAEPNPAYIAIIISIVALCVTVVTFVKKRKSEEFRIALDLNNKLEQIVNTMPEVSDKEQRRSKSLEYLNTWEYFAFLVKNNEIKNKNLKNYFKPSFVREVRKIFKDYPDVEKNEEYFKATRFLLKRWEGSSDRESRNPLSSLFAFLCSKF